MTRDFHETYVEPEVAPPSERSTGFVFAAVAVIVAILFRDDMLVLGVAAGLSLVFIALALAAPAVLRPLNLLWFRFSLLLNKIVNPLVLGLMFLVAIVPFGLVMRIWRDPLRAKRTTGSTYWIAREPRSSETHSMTNQF